MDFSVEPDDEIQEVGKVASIVEGVLIVQVWV